MKNNVYDYVVIGSGLSGLSIATALSRETSSVLLIEAQDFIGGQNHPQSPYSEFPSVGLRFLPDTELAHKGLNFLSQLIGQPISVDAQTHQAHTYESGEFRPFVGFGENSPAFYEPLSYFLAQSELRFSPAVPDWTALLKASYKGETLPRSFATRLQVQDGRAHAVLINGGQKTIQGHNFVFAGTVKQLLTLIPDESLNNRTRQKLSKGPYWTALCVDLYFKKEISTNSNIHLLQGTTEDEIGPCLGRFFPTFSAGEKTVQASQWLTFIEDEEAEDPERIGESLKKLKRQIKRAYPEALDQIDFEKIQVLPTWAGDGDLKLNSNQALPLVNNVWVASPTVNPQKNILGALMQAELVTSAMGCHPQGIEVQTSEVSTSEPEVSVSMP